jgi:hypothetical protein
MDGSVERSHKLFSSVRASTWPETVLPLLSCTKASSATAFADKIVSPLQHAVNRQSERKSGFNLCAVIACYLPWHVIHHRTCADGVPGSKTLGRYSESRGDYLCYGLRTEMLACRWISSAMRIINAMLTFYIKRAALETH